jgi:hypothetical protein
MVSLSRVGEQGGVSQPVSSGDLSFEEMSGQQVITGQNTRWPGLHLRTAHVTVPENMASIPPLAEDTLVVGLRGSVRARVRLSRAYEDALGPGWVRAR